ncbi:hypothetical protein [Paraburkholderia fungorum]|uniref:hypothetical protein n=1 Tax=Paraburkholderia fungorum TaxID=134537 RepID=UPI0038BA1FB8
MNEKKDKWNSASLQGTNDDHALIASLDALMPGERQQKIDKFQQAYPAIERALDRKVPQKKIVDELKRNGLDLSLGGLKAMLADERKRRKQAGDEVVCAHCGRALDGAISVANTSGRDRSEGGEQDQSTDREIESNGRVSLASAYGRPGYGNTDF